ncbi:hypothetical protein G195_009872 [Phytophthora kernoviae 00238/432]|uniref:Major facilitator superfamily (MFS) profile domain-containing protein n=1 Tax=Phytophthora kernoviae 00238/432 TaxID=1284355 RepID=A0A8J4S4E8_9STRA|nr:hypothetical protein G195_009872 [Phytophthora kernoviae 00238/432]
MMFIVYAMARHLSRSKSRKPHRNGFPLPRPNTTLSVLGNTVGFVKDNSVFHDWISGLAQELGDTPFLLTPLGCPDILVISTPEAFEDMAKMQFDNFIKGKHMSEMSYDLLGNALTITNGEDWRIQRKVFAKLFSTRALRESMASIIQKCSRKMHSVFDNAADENKHLDLFQLMNRFTMEAFAEVGFGIDLNSLTLSEAHPFKRVFDVAQEVTVTRFSMPTWIWKLQRLLGLGVEGQLQDDMKTIEANGTFVPEGTMVGLPSYAMGRKPSIWGSGCAAFKPERFLDTETGKSLQVPPFKFQAFHAALNKLLLDARGLLSQAFRNFARFPTASENPTDLAAARAEPQGISSKMNSFYVRGVGFFNDAYYLFVMNVINVVLTEQYGEDVYTSSMKSTVSAAVLIGAVVGQLLFGYLGDVFGRRVNMIATCFLLIFGGILCTVSYGGSAKGTLWFLVVARFVLGIGIGGEYPLAASSTAEDATSVSERNTRVALTFSLQGVGSLTAAMLGNLLVEALANSDVNDPGRLEIVWRLLFGLGVIPACIVCYYRITAEETDAYKAVAERRLATKATSANTSPPFSFIMRHYGISMLGTAGTWFLFDIVFYAQNLFSASILSVVGVENPSLQVITTQNVFIALMSLPGYYVAVFFINRIGRKAIQLQGFAIMTILFLVMAIFWDDLKENAVLFIILFGAALFFSNFGPNLTTFVMATEMYPTPIRSTCNGLSGAAGKAGAAIGSFGFSIWVENESFGYSGAFYTFAGITLISIPLTWFCMFNNEQGIEEMDAQYYAWLQNAEESPREVLKSHGESSVAYKASNSPV